MARETYRVHLATHHDGRVTGWLLSAQGAVDRAPSAYGRSEEEIYGQLALALEEQPGLRSAYLWSEKLHTRKVKVEVHPQTIVKRRHVIAKEVIELEFTYVWSKLEHAGYRVMLPRFGWWFVLEDIEMAADVIKQAVSNDLLGAGARSLYGFRKAVEERVVEWAPTLSRSSPAKASGWRRPAAPTLHAVAEELVARARLRRGRPVVGDVDHSGVMRIVLRRSPRSLLLVGPPGSGKSTWVRALARALSRRGADEPFTPRIWKTSADRIVAGQRYLGMWEQRCLDMVSELSGEGDYLYFDRLAGILGSRTRHSAIIDMFTPALLAGEISMIAECTPEEYERLASQRPVLANLLHYVAIQPTPIAAMPALLRDFQERVNPHLRIDPPGLRRLVSHLQFFQRDIGFPGKGFRFLDWLNQEHEAGRVPGAAIAAEGAEADDVVVMNAAAVSEAFSRSTGLPLELISDVHTAARERIAGKLRAGVIGQDQACDVAAAVIARFKAGLNDPERPLGSMFFVGPTGVGKTELAKQLTRYMFGDAERMVRLDMSEFMLPGSGQRLLGVGRGVRSLVERVRQRPLSLVLLDEIEKAHAEVFDLLLAMLGEGRMTDVDGRLVDFRMTVVIMTSNLGVRESGGVGFGDRSQRSGDFLAAVRRHFRPEFFNRIDHVIPFRNLSHDDIVQVVGLELQKASERVGFLRRGLRLRVDAPARAWLARAGWHPTRGARPLKRVIEERVVGPLAIRMAAEPRLVDQDIHVTIEGSPAHAAHAQRGAVVITLSDQSGD